ncbi:hypothetical protein CkaCkLH20_03840 [Colletotrichum karsti]|uniref:Uncharacterized protein n=1 Tax=Colletotrichum karsti TaxID=1095194 RepID=A0A9P6LMY6_9PEZI|nr:uncharacterized protein CkaCkLH20_03840 [Colletotrichum karsti]KAF9878940.1 hypothetical protein CkaCkLH20_03840 [Colletotrichum karsti]
MHEWQLRRQQEAETEDDAHAPSSLREILEMAPEANKTPIPVICCGKTEQIGRGVIEGLKPEYEVIHFITTPASGAAIIPAILAGQTPPPTHADSSAIGSGNYAAAPRAIILGSAFDDDALATIKKGVADAAAKAGGPEMRKVPWVRNDTSKPAPPIGPEYGRAVVARCKEALGRLEKEGKLDGGYDGDEWY